MSTGKILGYIAAGVLILFGVLYLLAASAPDRNAGLSILIGLILLAAGGGIIVAVRGLKGQAKGPAVYKVDLSGDTELKQLQCKSCGAELPPENVKMAADGSVMISCPYCNASYQLTESPKW